MKLSLGPENKEVLIEILIALSHWFPDNYDEIKNLFKCPIKIGSVS